MSRKTDVESKPTDEHTVFIFVKIHEQAAISCNDVTDLLCQHFKDLATTSRAVTDRMCKKWHYKCTVCQLVARDNNTIFYNGINLDSNWNHKVLVQSLQVLNRQMHVQVLRCLFLVV